MKTIKTIACMFLMAGLFACGNDREVLREDRLSGADTVNITVTGGAGQENKKQEETALKLVQTASVFLHVSEVKTSAQRIIGLARSLGGRVMNHHYALNENESTRLQQSEDSVKVISSCMPAVELVVRVPSDSLENFLLLIQRQNELVGEMTYSVSDKTIHFRENNLRNNLRQQYLNRKQSPKSISDSQAIQVADLAVSQIIANERIDRDVAYSAVELGISQSPIIMKRIIANTDLSAYQLPLTVRFSEALKTGADWFLTLMISLAHFWLIALIAAMGFMFYRNYKLQKRSRLAVIAATQQLK